jgi:hypothetical protein
VHKAGSFTPYRARPLARHGGAPYKDTLGTQVARISEAIELIELGARVGLVRPLTGIKKKVAKRLYRELMNCPSPPGQAPFTDAWYLESDLRMLHEAVVWQLYEGLKRPGQGQARALINVHQAYRQLVREPLLDLTRVALVPRLPYHEALARAPP